MSSFHLNIYFFLFRFRTRHSKMSLFHCSIWMKFLFWYGISFWYHVNWKRTVIWIRKIANFVLWGEWCMLSDLVRKPCEWECLRLRLDFRLLPGSAFDPSWRETLLGGMSAGSFSQMLAGNGGHLRGASLFYHVNAAWTLFWNETHSGMKVAAVQYNQPINLTSVVWSSV